MENTPSPDPSEAIERLSENFQQQWESLIRLSLGSRQREIHRLDPVSLAEGKLFEQYLFAESLPGRSGPEVGAVLENPLTSLTYSCKCFQGFPAGYEDRIMVAEPHLDMRGKDKRVSLPADKSGAMGMELSARYDASIVQAIANVLGERVLHSIEVGYEDSSRKKHYLANGYQARKGYPQVVDRIYEPIQKDDSEQ